MFVRIRGKGACPENSQAAIMHIRGFRHTHSGAPAQCFYPIITATATTSSSSPEAPAAVTVEARPFRFALFPFGIRAAALTAAQAKAVAADFDATSATSAMAMVDGETARMLWKETWNLYDILYDEVPLLPWTEEASRAATVAAAVEEQLRVLATTTAATAAADGGAVVLPSLASLAAQTDDFVLASARAGNKQVVVCPHYYAPSALPESAFAHIQPASHTHPGAAAAAAAVASSGPVLVLDLCDMSPALVGGKAMSHVAWYMAFAAMQPDSVLLHCRAVVVRLPYADVPTYAQALTNTQGDAATMADAFLEFVDFVGEHIAAVRHAMLRELTSAASSTAPEHVLAAVAPPPPLWVVGRSTDALGAAVRALTAGRSDGSVKAAAEVVVLAGDHLDAAAPAGGERVGQQANVYQALSEACGAAVTVVPVPLRALIDGGEEPWDAYTLKERTRLNFCPCCGDCSNDGAAEGGESHGHGHGHGHDHHHHA